MRRFDLTASLHVLDNDEELLREMLTVFLNVYPDLLEMIRTALSQQEPSGLMKAAHRMKGSLSVFGIDELTAMAAELERKGKSGTMHGAELLFDDLKQHVLDFAATAKERVDSPRG